MEEGDLVEHVGEPLTFLLPVEVETPDGIVEGFRSHADLGGQGLLAQMHEGTTQLEVLREVVLPVESHHRLAFLTIVALAFERDVNIGARVDDVLVEDGHLTRVVVHGVVASLGQGHAASRHHHRSLRHVVGAQRDDVGRGAAILSDEHVLVLLGYLLGHGLRGVIELGEGILVRARCRHAMLLEIVLHVGSEGFGDGEEDASVAHRVALHKIEVAVGVGFVVVVEAVSAEELDDWRTLHLSLGDVGDIDARGVALVLHVEAELLLLHRRGKVIDVLHHQAPVALRGVVARVLQGLDKEGLADVGAVAGELTHLVGHTTVGIFIGDSQHLVGLQSGAQRHIAQRRIDRIFRTGQEARTREFLKVGTTNESHALQRAGGLVDVAGLGVALCDGLILAVGLVGRHSARAWSPEVGTAHAVVLAQVGEGDNIAGIGGGSCLVSYPDLHAVDLHARGKVGERAHARVVVGKEIVGEEEMAVLLVVSDVDLKRGELLATLGGDALVGRLLLREHRLELQAAKLEVGADTEEAACALYEGIVGGEGDIASLNESHHLVLLAVILEFEVLRVEVEGGVGVVVEVHVDLVADLAIDVEVDLLVEVHRRGLAVADGERRVVDVLQRRTKLQFGGTLCLDTYAARAEDLLCWSEIEVHVGEVKLLLALLLENLLVLLAIEVGPALSLAPHPVLVWSHHDRRTDVGATDLVADDIAVDGVVVLHRLLHILRPLQVGGA